jgi:hypothetical protein
MGAPQANDEKLKPTVLVSVPPCQTPVALKTTKPLISHHLTSASPDSKDTLIHMQENDFLSQEIDVKFYNLL